MYSPNAGQLGSISGVNRGSVTHRAGDNGRLSFGAPQVGATTSRTTNRVRNSSPYSIPSRGSSLSQPRASSPTFVQPEPAFYGEEIYGGLGHFYPSKYGERMVSTARPGVNIRSSNYTRGPRTRGSALYRGADQYETYENDFVPITVAGAGAIRPQSRHLSRAGSLGSFHSAGSLSNVPEPRVTLRSRSPSVARAKNTYKSDFTGFDRNSSYGRGSSIERLPYVEAIPAEGGYYRERPRVIGIEHTVKPHPAITAPGIVPHFESTNYGHSNRGSATGLYGKYARY